MLALNHGLAQHRAIGLVLAFVTNNTLLRGAPLFLPLLLLWFGSDSSKRRARILAGLLASVVAVGISVAMQKHVAVHIRPCLDPSVHLAYIDPATAFHWERIYSFPSDVETLYAALATVIFLENRALGWAAYIWAFLAVAFRVALGWHYPSDILGALLLAISLVWIFERKRVLAGPLESLLQRYESRMAIVHALLFLYLAEAYELFPGIQGILHAVGKYSKLLRL